MIRVFLGYNMRNTWFTPIVLYPLFYSLHPYSNCFEMISP